MNKLLGYSIILPILSLLLSCNRSQPEIVKSDKQEVKLVVLGNVQDAGSPQAGCKKDCCKKLWDSPPFDRKVVSLGLIDGSSSSCWMFEASPDFVAQNEYLSKLSNQDLPTGIFISHAHIGHYTGLMFLGRESLGANSQQVYAMPRMKEFLSNNGPWDQLVSLKNITLNPLAADSLVTLSKQVSVVAFTVPHRDEYSETVGFKINGPNKSALFIPDIDKWGRWEKNIIDEIKQVDYALLDGTFYQNGELPNRDMSEIPHPFIEESLALFNNLSKEEKAKIHFIHFNHTNPLLDKNSNERKELLSLGFRIAEFHQEFIL